MHRWIIAVAVGLGTWCGGAQAQEAKVFNGPAGPANVGPAEQFVPDELIVVFDGPTAASADQLAPQGVTGVAPVDDVSRRLGVTGIRKQFLGAIAGQQGAGLPDLSGYFVVRFDATRHTLDEALAAYAALPHVTHVEKIGIHPIYLVPNDGNYPSQWHLNQGNDRDIDAPEAWNVETGNPAITVGVLDTGVRYYHKDLGGSAASSSNPTAADGNMWINTAEKNGAAGVDDDGNGYVDDWVGYDFVTGVTGCSTGEDCSTADADPRDFNGHGTHCAGNVAAMNNNGYATASPAGGWHAGVNTPTGNGVKVMALRIGYATPGGGFVRMDFAASAFYYAAAKGVKIASCSWGSSNSGGVAAALDTFIGSGGLVFVAAGNANNQTAGYLNSRSDCYSVAATDQNDVRASFSSYGTWVDIAAPGVSILSSYHNSADPANDYVANMNGTSMATPLVASAAAAVWSHNPAWNAGQVWTQVRDSTDNINAQNPSFVGLLGSGRLNLFNAVNTGGGGNTPPTVSITSPSNGSTVTVGTTVNFAGSATDAQDGNITAALSWTSNLQGSLGSGGSFSRNDLVVGTHTITASVTDSGGLPGSASVTLTVQNTPPPTPPNAPSNATAVKIASFTASVSWSDNSSNENGFTIERQRRVGNQWTETTNFSVGANVTNLQNTVGVAGKYRYRVQAFNGVGSSAFSNWAQINLNS